MSRRKRTTRTVTFVGGPRDGTTEQAPIGGDGVLDETSTPFAFHRYVGPVGAGYAEFVYEGLVDPEGNPTTIEAAAAAFQSELDDVITAARGTDVRVTYDGFAEELRADAEIRARERFRAVGDS